jgi:hypothetical protein
MLIALSGALAGVVHVVSGPDHLTAVAPLAIVERRASWLTGWTWGLGHSSGVGIVATLAVLLRDLLPAIDTISSWSEKLVGGALIAVGLWALKRGLRIGAAPHTHENTVHEHVHVQGGPALVRQLGHAHAAFWMGILHGVAGSSHFLGVLPALALSTRGAALTYIGAFAAASVITMTVFAGAIGVVANQSRIGGVLAHRALVLTGAASAIVVGGIWLM